MGRVTERLPGGRLVAGVLVGSLLIGLAVPLASGASGAIADSSQLAIPVALLGLVALGAVFAVYGPMGLLFASVVLALGMPEATDVEDALRLFVAGVPITPTDMLIGATVLGCGARCFFPASGPRAPAARRAARMVFPFGLVLAFGTVRGVLAGNSAYYILNDLHVMSFYLVAPILATALVDGDARRKARLALTTGLAAAPLLAVALVFVLPGFVTQFGDRLGFRNDASLVLLLPVVFIPLVRGKRPNALVLAIVLVLVAIKLLLGMSRSNTVLLAEVAVSTVLVCAWDGWLGHGAKVSRSIVRASVVTAVVLAVVVGLWATSPRLAEGIQSRFGELFSSVDDLTQVASYQIKALDIAGAWQIVDREPILGGGLGLLFQPNDPRALSERAAYIDQWWLVLWAKLGVLGLLAFGWLFVDCGRAVWQLSRRGSQSLGADDHFLMLALAAAGVPLVSLGFLIAFFGYYRQAWWLVVYIAVVAGASTQAGAAGRAEESVE